MPGGVVDVAEGDGMTADELARRAVACKHWRWLPGMLSRCATPTRRAAYRWLAVDTRHYGIVCVVEDKHGRPCRSVATLQPGPDDMPDLTDPATLGCLLALVHEAVDPMRAPGDWPMVCPYQSQAKKWGVGAWLNESGKATFAALVLPTYDTEAAALVAALEAAP